MIPTARSSAAGRVASLAACVLLLALAAPTTSAAGRAWWGVGLGAWFGGNVDYASVEPAGGYWVNDKLTVGARAILRYRRDRRLEDSTSQTDYGVAPFARFFPAKGFFVQGEIEWLSYERLVAGGTTDRDGYNSLWVGGGYSQPITPKSWWSVVAMYNLTWEDDEPSPYAEPWVVRAGIGFRF